MVVWKGVDVSYSLLNIPIQQNVLDSSGHGLPRLDVNQPLKIAGRPFDLLGGTSFILFNFP